MKIINTKIENDKIVNIIESEYNKTWREKEKTEIEREYMERILSSLDQQVRKRSRRRKNLYSSIPTLEEKPYFCVELNHPYESAECDRGWNGDGIYSAFT